MTRPSSARRGATAAGAGGGRAAGAARDRASGGARERAAAATRGRDSRAAGGRDAADADPTEADTTTAAARRRPSGPARARRGPRPPQPSAHHLRRRRVALIVLVGAVLAVLAIGVRAALYSSGLADVETVEITGALTVDADAVRAAADLTTGAPLAGVDTAGVRARVEALPGVLSVQVTRSWPHTVRVAVTERVAVAVADTGQGLQLVDATGLAYRPAPEIPPVLPRLAVATVAPGDPGTVTALTVLTALAEPVRSQVATLTVNPPITAGAQPSVALTLIDGRRVVWGSVDRTDRKAVVLSALLSQPGSVYDVASPELPTVRR